MVCCGNPDAKCCGYPSGFGILVPLAFATAALVTSSYSMLSCRLVSLANGQSIQILGELVAATSGPNSTQSMGMRENYHYHYHTSQTYKYTANTFGLFSFQGSTSGEYDCVNYADWGTINGFWKSGIAFSLLDKIFGLMVFFWLLLSICCPIQPVHKTALIILSLLTFVFSAFSFFFYGNQICEEHGCKFTTGVWYQISGAILYLGTAIILMGEKATSRSLTPPQPYRSEQAMVEKETEEGIQPSLKGLFVE